ncbi:MAG: PstS family phosphate ABC transporter substrate-binding protein [Methanoregulaceae archaeon]|nr:PstS family phosphate ABC transporter substrate-binding protein [Methanoregulaceae archaeon]
MKGYALLAVVMVLAGLLVAGCANTPSTNATSTNPSGGGKITVSGAFALYPMMVKWAEEYRKIHPEVIIEISGGGAGKGMTDALNGLADIGMVSREIYPQEIAQGAAYVAVVKDAVIGTINVNNPVISDLNSKGINRTLLKAIYINNTVTDWGSVAGRSVTQDKINVYTRSDACGAATIWAQYIGNYTQEDLKGVGVNADPGVAEAVRNDRLGIGYNNINFAYDPTTEKPITGLSILKLDLNDNGVIDPAEDFYGTRQDIIHAIDTGAYPSPPSRELNIVTRGSFKGPTKDFVAWILTDGQKYALETGYIPISSEKIQAELKQVNG